MSLPHSMSLPNPVKAYDLSARVHNAYTTFRTLRAQRAESGQLGPFMTRFANGLSDILNAVRYSRYAIFVSNDRNGCYQEALHRAKVVNVSNEMRQIAFDRLKPEEKRARLLPFADTLIEQHIPQEARDVLENMIISGNWGDLTNAYKLGYDQSLAKSYLNLENSSHEDRVKAYQTALEEFRSLRIAVERVNGAVGLTAAETEHLNDDDSSLGSTTELASSASTSYTPAYPKYLHSVLHLHGQLDCFGQMLKLASPPEPHEQEHFDMLTSQRLSYYDRIESQLRQQYLAAKSHLEQQSYEIANVLDGQPHHIDITASSAQATAIVNTLHTQLHPAPGQKMMDSMKRNPTHGVAEQFLTDVPRQFWRLIQPGKPTIEHGPTPGAWQGQGALLPADIDKIADLRAFAGDNPAELYALSSLINQALPALVTVGVELQEGITPMIPADAGLYTAERLGNGNVRVSWQQYTYVTAMLTPKGGPVIAQKWVYGDPSQTNHTLARHHSYTFDGQQLKEGKLRVVDYGPLRMTCNFHPESD